MVGPEWKCRAVAFLYGLLSALVYLRDEQGKRLDVPTIRHYLTLSNFVTFASEFSRIKTPEAACRPLSTYLDAVGYLEGHAQPETIADAHGHQEALFPYAHAAIEAELLWYPFKVKRRSVA